jgi:hypothetical protein
MDDHLGWLTGPNGRSPASPGVHRVGGGPRGRRGLRRRCNRPCCRGQRDSPGPGLPGVATGHQCRNQGNGSKPEGASDRGIKRPAAKDRGKPVGHGFAQQSRPTGSVRAVRAGGGIDRGGHAGTVGTASDRNRHAHTTCGRWAGCPQNPSGRSRRPRPVPTVASSTPGGPLCASCSESRSPARDSFPCDTHS